jgi:hypothetical protein
MDSTQKEKPRDGKKIYAKPTLELYGSVGEITSGSGMNGSFDGTGNMNNNNTKP